MLCVGTMNKFDQITLCGGGNVNHNSIAAIGHHNPHLRINVLTRRPQDWSDKIVSQTAGSPWARKGPLTGHINLASSNPADVIPGSQFIVIGGPANAHYEILEKIAPYVDNYAYVGTVFGQGSFDFQAKSAFKGYLEEKNIVVFGLKHVPYLCQCTKYGHEAKIIGVKTSLYIATYPYTAGRKCAQICEYLWKVPAKQVPNFLTLTLTPSNQIIHPGRTYGVWKDWDGKTPVDQSTIPTLYDKMDQLSADQIEKLDFEMFEVINEMKRRLPTVDLSETMRLRERIAKDYKGQVGDSSTMLNVFNTNKGYIGVKFPVVKVGENKALLNTKSRFFTEDIPFGLIVIKSYADLCGVKVPNIERQILWHQKFINDKFMDENGQLNKDLIGKTGSPFRYGITKIQDLAMTNSIPPTLQAKI